MFPLKAGSLVPRQFAVRAFQAAVLAATFSGTLYAQPAKSITVLVLDGKTGQPVMPSNLLVRVDHLDAVHNEWLQLNDDGTGKVTLPAAASFLAIQATYESSTEIYVNCDAAMEKNISTLHWYSTADILTSGVAMPNECYKGKFAEATHVDTKPGQFIIFVRKNNWHEMPPE